MIVCPSGKEFGFPWTRYRVRALWMEKIHTGRALPPYIGPLGSTRIKSRVYNKKQKKLVEGCS